MSSSSSGSLVTESVVSFLKNVPPFQFLSTTELAMLARTMALEYFPRDTVILRAGGKVAESLYIIQKGAVKLAIRSGVGKEIILDLRGEGDLFGLLSLLGGDVARLDVVAVEDTLAYSLPAAEVDQLIARNTVVAGFLFRKSTGQYMDRCLNELRERSQLLGDSERLLYTLSVRDAVSSQPLTAALDVSIKDAAQLMAAKHARSLFLLNENGSAAGVVTDQDFTRQVAARGLPLDSRVTSIMSSPVISVETTEPLFQALLTMIGRGIHHLLVTDQGRPTGVLSDDDLLLFQGKSPLNLARSIDQQQTVADLAACRRRMSDLLPLLLREGAKASHIARVVAGIHDRIMRRVMELAEAQLGPPPAPYCWVVFGSEGRSEQTFTTDQDNALIYADGASDTYYERLAAFAKDALEQCGFPACPGEFMATNPRWRQPLHRWKQYFSEWAENADRRSVQDALILLDLRPVAGDAALCNELLVHNRPLFQRAMTFQSVLGFIAIENKPPLGFFRTFVVERGGRQKDQLDLKMNGTGLIVNIARVFAVAAGIEATNTVDRLARLEEGSDGAAFGELREAFEFLMLLRLENQLRQARSAETLNNYLEPGSLTHLQRNMLREAFQAIARGQGLVEAKFRSAIWPQLAMS